MESTPDYKQLIGILLSMVVDLYIKQGATNELLRGLEVTEDQRKDAVQKERDRLTLLAPLRDFRTQLDPSSVGALERFLRGL